MTSLLCIFATTCSLALILLQLGADALPLNQTELHERTFSYNPFTGPHDVHIDTGRYVLGYFYVSTEKAKEYNHFERLTSIPTSGKQLGEGVYLSPRSGMFPSELLPAFSEQSEVLSQSFTLLAAFNESFNVQCVVIGSEQALKKAPKLFVANTPGTNENPGELARYIRDHGYSHYGTKQTILFAEHHYYLAMNNYQMLIPPAYIVPPPTTSPGAHKDPIESLEMQVNCVPMGCMGIAPSAGWEAWHIEYWPKAVQVRAEKQHCSAASAAPPVSPNGTNGTSVAHGAPSTKEKKEKRDSVEGVEGVGGITARGTGHESAKTLCPFPVLSQNRLALIWLVTSLLLVPPGPTRELREQLDPKREVSSELDP
ncbi:hypothetical protein BDP27DRAFT_1374536 [Rhodocollybia butyracea]|uniref:Uncharacterized protein n=1 Tax=Rhodocollybia butyracea TaxID=206335 RepID=A0A9P5P2P8_9AGAR|nr:hypothetical protein BDP27DRAFT_1374536 [Rhodocollybia butyracea]